MNILKSIKNIKPANTRNIFGSLNVIFNRVNEKRIKEVGPDRACAEWLMRNGAHIRWKGQQSLLTDYNLLPLDAKETGDYQIEEVSAKEASISHHGFEHFYGCQCITTMKFDKCWYFDDLCLLKLHTVANSLLCLELTRCDEITDDGLLHLTVLKNLQILRLGELKGVKDLQNCVNEICDALPYCQISPVLLNGCNGVKIMKFEKCWFFDNSCMKQLPILSNSLLHLEIIKCSEVTDEGLHFITGLKNLRYLGLQDLEAVKDIHKCASEISSALPNCQVSTEA